MILASFLSVFVPPPTIANDARRRRIIGHPRPTDEPSDSAVQGNLAVMKLAAETIFGQHALEMSPTALETSPSNGETPSDAQTKCQMLRCVPKRFVSRAPRRWAETCPLPLDRKVVWEGGAPRRNPRRDPRRDPRRTTKIATKIATRIACGPRQSSQFSLLSSCRRQRCFSRAARQ